MRKIIAKFLIILIILQIISPIWFIGQVFAVSNSWDFSTTSDYSLSDTNSNHIRIENSLVRLPYHLEHLWAITDTSLDGARRVIVKWNYAFLSSYRADKILSIDISDPSNPTIAFTLSNWDQWVNLDWPIWLAFTWNYLYVAWYLSDNINIIDISDPTNLIFVREIADDAWNQQLNWAKDIKISWSHLYVTSYADDAFNVFDNTNPSNPIYKKHIKDSTKLDWANRAIIDWNYAYIASDRNDSFEIIDLTNQDTASQNISIMSELTDGTAWALLDWARAVSFSGNLAYVSSNISDALEIIDISDKINPIHTWSIINQAPVKLNAPRANILYNWFNFSAARSSDAIEVINISNPINPVHESEISRVAGSILLNWANDIVNSWSLFYVSSYVDDALEILKAKYSDNSPYVIPNNSYNYTWSLNSFSDILWAWNEGNITYQISYDAWNNWYWFDWSNWQQTSNWVIESSSASVINSNLYKFNKLNSAGTGSFLFKAFLNSDWTQKVELDRVNITTVESPTDISNPVFWYDGQDTDWDWNSSNEPSAGAEVSPLIDKFNSYNAYNNTSGEVPTYNTWAINNHPNLIFDWTNDHYIIDNQNAINSASSYYEKSFALVFKTWDDTNTFQNIYEQGWGYRWFNFQIENGNLYAWVWNNQEWSAWNQYKFVNLWSVNSNTVYYTSMVFDVNNDVVNYYLNWNLISSLNNIDYQRVHNWWVWIWFVNWDTIKASDNSSTNWPAYFKWNVWEFLSWNHVLTDNERVWVDMYLKNKWDLELKIYPVIISSSISDNEVFSTWSFDFNFTYKDWENGPWIDVNSDDIKLYKYDSSSSSWGSDISWTWVTRDSVTTSTGSYHTNNLEVGDYKMIFSISNLDWNPSSKEVLFSVDLTWTPWKIFHFDGQNVDWDNNSSNEPSDWSSISTWVDIKNTYNATQSTSWNQALYSVNTINNHPSFYFNWTSDYYDIANQADINTATSYDVKAFSMVLKTSDDVTTFQNLYEQWGSARWYAIQIENGHLYMWAWNNNEWDSWNQYKFVDLGVINSNEIYNILFIQDSTDWTDAWNFVKAYIDWNLAWTLTHVDIQKAHSWDINIWYNKDWRKYDWTSPWEWHYYKWNIWEFISWNYSLDDTEIDTLNEYLRTRWDLDKVAPVISSGSIASWSLLPWANHNISFSYSDSSEYWTWAWINTNSWNLVLEKWDSWSSSWLNVSNLIWTWTLTQTQASYPMQNLDYWKYKASFDISDNNWNKSDVYSTTFYIDRPELLISTWSINIWTLNDSTNTFGDTITVTVKTVWAPFRVKLNKNTALTHSNNSDFIPYYDWSLWMWYDKNNDWNLSDYNNDIILSNVENINTNWDLNIYTYTLKMWAIIDIQQASWDYSWKIDFGIELDY